MTAKMSIVEWYLSVRNLLRALDQKAKDALNLCETQGEEATAAVKRYLKTDYEQLWDLWERRYPNEHLGNLGRHLSFGAAHDYSDIINNDIPSLEERAEGHLLDEGSPSREMGFEALLHPIITEHAYQLYRNGHYREAVLNSITALFDFIRLRTNSSEDGDRLIGQVFALENPHLILSELETESGQNDQKGFMQIYKGAYQGIRNPKAHSLTHDLTPNKAAEYLVFASLLVRRVEGARLIKKRSK